MITEPHCKNAVCPPEKMRMRPADAGGLYLEVPSNCSKWWFPVFVNVDAEGVLQFAR